MTFLPIVGRELRVAARRRATYWSRFTMAITAIFVGILTYISAFQNSVPVLSGTLFMVLSGLAFVYCLVVGVRATADCLSEEKREGTLGLLFLTDLKGYDVILGKLVATSLNSFFGLIAIFPVLAIPLLMGGITNGEFWRMALVLANSFFFSLAMGMLMSAICESPRKAMGATFILILFICVGLPIIENNVPYARTSPSLKRVFHAVNPSYSFALADSKRFGPPGVPNLFWASIVVVHGTAWILLGLASVIVPHSWQDKPAGVKGHRLGESLRRLSFGHAGARAAYRKRLLDINAYLWLAVRARLKFAFIWLVFAGLTGLWIWGLVANGKEWVSPPIYLVTAFTLNAVLKVWIASESGRRFGEDRRSGALELLLSTSLRVRDILHGQLLALQRQFFGPLLFALAIEVIFLPITLKYGHLDGEDTRTFKAVAVVAMVTLVADVLAVTSVGMWVGLTAKNPNRATGITVRRVLILPWAIFGAVCFCIALADYTPRRVDVSWRFYLGLYVVAGMVTDVISGSIAWQRLNQEFRLKASQRFEPPRSIWSALTSPPAANSPPFTTT